MDCKYDLKATALTLAYVQGQGAEGSGARLTAMKQILSTQSGLLLVLRWALSRDNCLSWRENYRQLVLLEVVLSCKIITNRLLIFDHLLSTLN